MCAYVCVFSIVWYTVPLIHSIIGLVCAYNDLIHPQVFHHCSGQDCHYWCRHPQLEQEHYPKGTVPAPEFHLQVNKGTMSLYVSSNLVDNLYHLFLLHSSVSGCVLKDSPVSSTAEGTKAGLCPRISSSLLKN